MKGPDRVDSERIKTLQLKGRELESAGKFN